MIAVAGGGTASIVVDCEAFEQPPRFRPSAILSVPGGSLPVSDSGSDAIWRITIGE